MFKLLFSFIVAYILLAYMLAGFVMLLAVRTMFDAMPLLLLQLMSATLIYLLYCWNKSTLLKLFRG